MPPGCTYAFPADTTMVRIAMQTRFPREIQIADGAGVDSSSEAPDSF